MLEHGKLEMKVSGTDTVSILAVCEVTLDYIDFKRTPSKILTCCTELPS